MGNPASAPTTGRSLEIARSGGGCLTVDPRGLAEIAAGFEALATDGSTYGALLKQLAARHMRRWSDYAAAIMSELDAFSPDRVGGDLAPAVVSAAGLGIVIPQLETTERSVQQFVISMDDLKTRDEYDRWDDRPPLRQDSRLQYLRESHGSISPRVLFYGPYTRLAPGDYTFTFDGEIDGELVVAFSADGGRRKLEGVALTNFAAPVRVRVPEAVERFEIVGKKTASLMVSALRALDFLSANDRERP